MRDKNLIKLHMFHNIKQYDLCQIYKESDQYCQLGICFRYGYLNSKSEPEIGHS